MLACMYMHGVKRISVGCKYVLAVQSVHWSIIELRLPTLRPGTMPCWQCVHFFAAVVMLLHSTMLLVRHMRRDVTDKFSGTILQIWVS